MLTFQDCVALCELTDEEIAAIAEHEHVTMHEFLVRTAATAVSPLDLCYVSNFAETF